jgi:hypothetical protein
VPGPGHYPMLNDWSKKKTILSLVHNGNTNRSIYY